MAGQVENDIILDHHPRDQRLMALRAARDHARSEEAQATVRLRVVSVIGREQRMLRDDAARTVIAAKAARYRQAEQAVERAREERMAIERERYAARRHAKDRQQRRRQPCMWSTVRCATHC